MNVRDYIRRVTTKAPQAAAPAGKDPLSLLDPAVVSRVDALEMVSTRVVEGYLTGKHRSPYKGGCVEFAEHRSYSPGDEIRLLDWRALAKSDRYYIKQYEEETNLQAMIVLDASGSMGFGESTASKLQFAQTAAASLARLMLHQRDAVGLAVIDTAVRSLIPPRSRPAHLRSLLHAMADIAPGGETSLAAVLHELAQRLSRRGLVVVFSDCFDDLPPLLNALQHIRSRGHDVLLFHVMAPEEIAFTFSKWSRFECMEVEGRRLELDPSVVRDRYLQRVGKFLEELQHGCGEIGCDYAPLATDRDLGKALAFYLHRRMARRK